MEVPLAGSVQVVRKHPVAARFADLTLAYGRYGTYEGAADANLASRDGKLALRVNAVGQGTDGYRDGREGSIAGINPSFVWRPEPGTRVALSYEYLHSNQSPDSGLPFLDGSLAGASRTTSYQSPSDFSEQDVQRLRLDAERRLNDTFVLRDKLYFSALDWNTDGTLVLGAFPFPDGRTYVPRTQGLLDDRQRLFGNQLELAASFHTGDVAHQLVTGFEASRLNDTYTQNAQLLQPLDLTNPFEADLGIYPIPLPQASQAGDSRSLVIAPYLIDRITLLPALRDPGRRPLGQRRLRGREHRHDARRIAPEPARRAGLQARAGGFALRERRAGFRATVDPGGGPARPRGEHSARGRREAVLPGRQGYAGAAVYQLERENIAVPDSTGLSRQSGSQRSRGFELELSAEPKPGLSARVHYAYTSAELTAFSEFLQTEQGFFVLDRTGNVPAFAPRHIASFWGTTPLGKGFSLGAGLRYVSEQFVAPDNRNVIDGYALCEGAVFYARGLAKIGVHLRNLTGTEYATRGFGSDSAIPGRPFEAMARVELGFGRR